MPEHEVEHAALAVLGRPGEFGVVFRMVGGQQHVYVGCRVVVAIGLVVYLEILQALGNRMLFVGDAYGDGFRSGRRHRPPYQHGREGS